MSRFGSVRTHAQERRWEDDDPSWYRMIHAGLLLLHARDEEPNEPPRLPKAFGTGGSSGPAVRASAETGRRLGQERSSAFRRAAIRSRTSDAVGV
jgi:hypothetical protein